MDLVQIIGAVSVMREKECTVIPSFGDTCNLGFECIVKSSQGEWGGRTGLGNGVKESAISICVCFLRAGKQLIIFPYMYFSQNRITIRFILKIFKLQRIFKIFTLNSFFFFFFLVHYIGLHLFSNIHPKISHQSIEIYPGNSTNFKRIHKYYQHFNVCILLLRPCKREKKILCYLLL